MGCGAQRGTCRRAAARQAPACLTLTLALPLPPPPGPGKAGQGILLLAPEEQHFLRQLQVGRGGANTANNSTANIVTRLPSPPIFGR